MWHPTPLSSPFWSYTSHVAVVVSLSIVVIIVGALFIPLQPIRNMYAHIPQRGEGRRLRVVTIKYINKRRTYEQSWRSSGVEKCEGEDGRWWWEITTNTSLI
jgi:hypothetical protein